MKLTLSKAISALAVGILIGGAITACAKTGTPIANSTTHEYQQ